MHMITWSMITGVYCLDASIVQLVPDRVPKRCSLSAVSKILVGGLLGADESTKSYMWACSDLDLNVLEHIMIRKFHNPIIPNWELGHSNVQSYFSSNLLISIHILWSSAADSAWRMARYRPVDFCKESTSVLNAGDLAGLPGHLGDYKIAAVLSSHLTPHIVRHN